MQANLDPQDFKQTVKEALVELLTEEPAVLRDLLAEALEDVVFADAIREGRTTPMTTRESVLEVLEDAG
ncbi:hypothetical protein [Halochromatium glycolicum]|jgi:hypothetical protein|uniref:Uncharacterized protein n=1 Tax=Halochromatium glycolicum TaxID=85075 RepID=A0AAJ0U1N9_9GAMM|nr:hypothetical protein [Halochromatium glycolicum]MBK1703629.1 hypothetical protein [Halochromatium glycolicum]